MATVVFVQGKNNKKILKALDDMEDDLDESQKSGLSSSGFFMSREVSRFMKTEGRGTWPKIHPLTARFEKVDNPQSVFGQKLLFGGEASLRKRASIRKFSHLASIGLFARYIVDGPEGVRIGFAFSGRPSKFDKKMNKAVTEAAKRQFTKVTPRMRRFFAAATEELGTRNTGVDFFPLSNRVNVLVTEKRETENPVSKTVAPKIFPLFEKKFSKSLGRKNLFADKQFLKGESAEKDASFEV